MSSGIYKILNKITEKFYIGSAVNFKARWTQHKGKLRLNIHPNAFLQSSWNLHGEEAFEFIVLEKCSKQDLLIAEQKWLDDTQCYDRNIGYNLYRIAGSPLGSKWSEERKAKAKKRMTGFKHTEEAKARMKEIQSNRPKEIGAKISAGKMGHKQSEETKLKIKAANIHLNDKNFREKQKLSVSKPDKWPHGIICKCRECLDKKNEYNKNYRKAIKEAQNVQAI
jgi:group I intron endonuclease